MDWESDKHIAKIMLRDRSMRRKIMTRMLLIVLGLMVIGLWVVDDWLKSNPWIFLLWWGGCGFLTCITMLMALYDMVAVIREEREKHD